MHVAVLVTVITVLPSIAKLRSALDITGLLVSMQTYSLEKLVFPANARRESYGVSQQRGVTMKLIAHVMSVLEEE
jgi:hypothetical protein